MLPFLLNVSRFYLFKFSLSRPATEQSCLPAATASRLRFPMRRIEYMLKTKINVISNLFQFNDTVIAINIKFIFLLLTREPMKRYFEEIYEKDKIKSAVSTF